MSRNQKAPLLAFVLVALVCGLILVDTMRGEAKSHPLVVLSPEQLGPAYFLAPDPEPLQLADEADESPSASTPPDAVDPGVSHSPDSIDEGLQGPSGSQASGPGRRHGGSQVQGTPDDDATGPVDDDSSARGDQWPPSAAPVIKHPVVVFTIFGADLIVPGDQPSQAPSQQPTEQPSPHGVQPGSEESAEPEPEPTPDPSDLGLPLVPDPLP